ncbi:MAG TPA: hypothetical protein VM123_03720 [archaeon]|nr:hypothetical protein [archaeon]
MKHFSFILLAALLALSSTQVYGWSLKDESGELLKVNGHMQYRGRYYDLDFIRGGDQDQKGHLNRHNYYGDLSLSFGITPHENITAFFEFNKLIFLGQEFRYNTIQTGEEVMPEDVPFTITDAQGKTISVKLPLRRNTDEAWEPHLRQAWMDVKFPGMKLKLKFGRQPFQLGNGIYTNTNIASVFGYQFHTDLGPGKPEFRAGSMKYYEGLRENYNYDYNVNDVDDVDLFFGDLSIPIQKSKLGLFLTYFRDNSQDLNLLSHINLGMTLDLATQSGWSLKSEFDYQNGKKEYSTGSDIDWTGYAFMASVGFPPLANKKLRLSAEFGIGSGDDPATPNKFEGYVAVGPFYPYAWAYEYRFIHLVHNASNFFALHSRGMATNLAPGMENTTYFKTTWAFSLPHKCAFIFSPIWLGLTQQGETFGWEFDNIFIAPVWKNFSYMFVFAYVQPADWMKNRGFDDPAFGIRSQLEFTF